jgi:hypothetical protein
VKPSRSIPLPLLALVAWLAPALSSPACSACFGRSNDKMISAYYVGAVLLVGLVTLVLGGITTFFVVIARRASSAGRAARTEQPATPLQS